MIKVLYQSLLLSKKKMKQSVATNVLISANLFGFTVYCLAIAELITVSFIHLAVELNKVV